MNFLEAYGIKQKTTSDMSDKKKVNLFDFTNVKKPSELMAQQTKPTQSGFSNVPKTNQIRYNDIDLENAQKLKDLGVPQDKIIELVNKKKQQREGVQEQPKQEQGFFESVRYKPYTQEEVTAFDPNKSTAQNLIEGQGRYIKNTAGGLYNILPGIAQLGTGLVKGVGIDMYNKVGSLFGMDITEYTKGQTEKTNQLLTGIVTHYKDTYGSTEGLNKAIIEDPTAVISDALTVLGVGLAGKSKLNSIQKTALETEKANIINQVKNATTLEQKSALIKQGIEKSKQIIEKTKQVDYATAGANTAFKYDPYVAVPSLAIKGTILGANKSAQVLNKVGTPTTEYATKLLTGLNRDTQRFIKNEPDLWKKINSGEITAEQLAQEVKTRIQSRLDALSETGKGYEVMKQDGTKFSKEEIQGIYDNVTNKEGLSKDLIELPLEDRGAIKQAQAYLDEYKGKELTTKEIIELKAKLRSLVSYGKGVTPQGERIVKGIISDLDSNLKSKVPGYAELDKTYGPERNFLNQVKKDILKPDGTLKDNAISIIRNMSNKGKEFKLERFEDIFPGITKQIEGIKAFEDLQASIEGKTGSYARGVLLGGGGYAAGGVVGGLVTFILTHPKVASTILEGYGLSKQYISQLFAKIKGKGIISKQEQNIIENAIKTTKSDDLLNNIQKDDGISTVPNSNNTNTRLLQKERTTQTSKIDDIPPDEPPALGGTKLKPKDKPTPTPAVTKPKLITHNQSTNVSNKPIIKPKKTAPTTPLKPKTDTTQVEVKKTSPELSDKGGVKTITPEFQHKFNQGADYEPVRVISNPTDSKIIRYGALENKYKQSVIGKGNKLTEGEKLELKSIEKELGLSREDIMKRSNEIKEMAKQVRDPYEQVILDLNKKTPLKPKPFNKSETTKKLQTLTKDNVDDVARSFTSDAQKLAKIKVVIKRYIKEYGENLKNYLGLLADDIADIIGGRSKLLGGENAKLFDKSRWQQAKEMTKAGKSADDIWKETGWEKGTDGKWKFEIDDSKAKLNNIDKNNAYKGETYFLSEILEHNDLYKQYPKLKGVKVNFKTGKDGLASTYKDPTDPAGFVIDINFNQLTPGKSKELKSTLLHEIQHNIQEIENFGKGGSVRLGKEMAQDLEIKIDNLNRQMSNALKKDDKDLYYKLMDERSDVVKELRNLQNDFGMSGYEGYKKLAGETEARNVQTRLLKTPTENKLLRPAKTEDVARDKQIVKMDGGKAMSIGRDKTALLKGSDDLEVKGLDRLAEKTQNFKNAKEFKMHYQKNPNTFIKDELGFTRIMKNDIPLDLQKNVQSTGLQGGGGYYKTKDGNYLNLSVGVEGDTLYIDSFYIAKQKTGLGTKIMKAFEDYAVANNLSFKINKDVKSAATFYDKFNVGTNFGKKSFSKEADIIIKNYPGSKYKDLETFYNTVKKD